MYIGIEIFDKEIKKETYIEKNIIQSYFENYKFIEVNFIDCIFEDIIFENSTINLTKFNGCKFDNVKFKNCEIIGVNFSELSKFILDFSLEGTLIKYCTFIKLDLKKLKFIRNIIEETSFEECNMKEIIMENNKFKEVYFKNCDMRKGNFKDCSNLQVNPLNNNLKNAIFSLDSGILILKELGIKIEN